MNDSKKLSEKAQALFEQIKPARWPAASCLWGRRRLTGRNSLGHHGRHAPGGGRALPGARVRFGGRQPRAPGPAIAAAAQVKGDAQRQHCRSIGPGQGQQGPLYAELDAQYPQYQLAKHRGYPTKLHYELLAQYGFNLYRRSF